ncbi:MAG: trypsin-like peptidase domain-containing protein, partial [Gemmatimonadota bacterium]
MAKRSVWFAAGFSLLLVLGVALARRSADDGLMLPAEDSMAAAALQDTIGGSRRNAIVVASQRVAPAVVSVNVVRQSRQPRTMWESLFFPETSRRDAGLGSGFIIREDGLVLTNEHVVRGASEVVVTLADGRDFAATIVGRDEVTDLALLRLRDAKGLPVAPMGTSNNLIIGEWAVAIGNPYGFYLSNAEPTVTAGVISGVSRNIIPNGNENEGVYLDMIQTDAS